MELDPLVFFAQVLLAKKSVWEGNLSLFSVWDRAGVGGIDGRRDARGWMARKQVAAVFRPCVGWIGFIDASESEPRMVRFDWALHRSSFRKRAGFLAAPGIFTCSFQVSW